MERHLEIGVLVDRHGITRRAFRYYEERGYLGSVARLSDGTRVFAPAQVALIERVAPLLQAGLDAEEAFAVARQGQGISDERLAQLIDGAARNMQIHAAALSGLHEVERCRRREAREANTALMGAAAVGAAG